LESTHGDTVRPHSRKSDCLTFFGTMVLFAQARLAAGRLYTASPWRAFITPPETSAWNLLIEKLRHALARGGLHVAVLGGSVTMGVGCVDAPVHPEHPAALGEKKTLSWDQCAWPARLQDWLVGSAARGALGKSIVHNLAMRGTTSTSALRLRAQSLFRMDRLDVVIVDYQINDLGNADFASVEQLLRVCLCHPSRPAVVMVEQRESLAQHIKPAQHLNVPVLLLASALEKPFPKNVHVAWDWHQNFADIIAFAFSVQFRSIASLTAAPELCDDMTTTHMTSMASVDADEKGRIDEFVELAELVIEQTWDLDLDLDRGRKQLVGDALADHVHKCQASELPKPAWVNDANAAGSCIFPLSFYSAQEAIDKNGHDGVKSTSWELYEDRPGKPGWIAIENSTHRSDTISFALNISENGYILLGHLATYENTGWVEAWVDDDVDNRVRLNSRWKMQTSQLQFVSLWMHRGKPLPNYLKGAALRDSPLSQAQRLKEVWNVQIKSRPGACVLHIRFLSQQVLRAIGKIKGYKNVLESTQIGTNKFKITHVIGC